MLSKGFGAGFNGPLTVVVDSTGQKNPKQIANAAAKALGQFPDVAAASAAGAERDRRGRNHLGYPRDGPSKETKNLVSSIRRPAAQVREQYGIDILVTGTTAINIDVSDKLSWALPVMLILSSGWRWCCSCSFSARCSCR